MASGLDGGAAAKVNLGPVEPLDLRHHPNPPSPDGSNESVIENRHGPGTEELSEAVARRRRKSELGDIGNGDGRRSTADIGFISRSGTRFSVMPINWLGMPNVSRRTMLGGVRTDRSTLGAGIRELDRDFGSRIAGPDHDHVTAVGTATARDSPKNAGARR